MVLVFGYKNIIKVKKYTNSKRDKNSLFRRVIKFYEQIVVDKETLEGVIDNTELIEKWKSRWTWVIAPDLVM